VAVLASFEQPLSLELDYINFDDRASCVLVGMLIAESQT
jgi:hypothetical protein